MGLTWLNDVGELFANGHHQDFFPEILGLRLGDAKRPGATLDVSWVFPHRLDATLEEVDGVFELEAAQGEGVEDFPEWFDGDDVVFHEGETALVIVAVAVLVVVEAPGVLEERSSKLPEEGDAALDFWRAVLRGGCFDGACSVEC